MWVYTTYGEHVASLHGTTRKAGEPATFNGKPLTEKKAKAWSDRGYIYWKETDHDHSVDCSGRIAAKIR